MRYFLILSLLITSFFAEAQVVPDQLKGEDPALEYVADPNTGRMKFQRKQFLPTGLSQYFVGDRVATNDAIYRAIKDTTAFQPSPTSWIVEESTTISDSISLERILRIEADNEFKDTIFILASGQSNMVTFADAVTDTISHPKFVAWDDSTSTWRRAEYGVNPFYKEVGHQAFYAGRELARKGYYVRLVLYAVGSQPIAEWDDGELMWNRLTSHWDNSGAYRPADLFMWAQGESDGGQTVTYYENKWIDLKARLQARGMIDESTRITLMELADDRAMNAYITTLDDDDNPLETYIETDDLNTTDGVHFDSPGQHTIGLRAAAFYLAVSDGKSVNPYNVFKRVSTVVTPTDWNDLITPEQSNRLYNSNTSNNGPPKTGSYYLTVDTWEQGAIRQTAKFWLSSVAYTRINATAAGVGWSKWEPATPDFSTSNTSSIDWNTITADGYQDFLIRGDRPNGPTPGQNISFHVIVYNFSTTGTTQIAIPWVATADMYIRHRASSSWTAWKPVSPNWNTEPLTSNADAGGFVVSNSGPPVNPGDLTNKEYVDGIIANGGSPWETNTSSTGGISYDGVATVKGSNASLVKEQNANIYSARGVYQFTGDGTGYNWITSSQSYDGIGFYFSATVKGYNYGGVGVFEMKIAGWKFTNNLSFRTSTGGLSIPGGIYVGKGPNGNFGFRIGTESTPWGNYDIVELSDLQITETSGDASSIVRGWTNTVTTNPGTLTASGGLLTNRSIPNAEGYFPSGNKDVIRLDHTSTTRQGGTGYHVLKIEGGGISDMLMGRITLTNVNGAAPNNMRGHVDFTVFTNNSLISEGATIVGDLGSNEVSFGFDNTTNTTYVIIGDGTDAWNANSIISGDCLLVGSTSANNYTRKSMAFSFVSDLSSLPLTGTRQVNEIVLNGVSEGDDLGDHTATQNLDMAGNTITNLPPGQDTLDAVNMNQFIDLRDNAVKLDPVTKNVKGPGSLNRGFRQILLGAHKSVAGSNSSESLFIGFEAGTNNVGNGAIGIGSNVLLNNQEGGVIAVGNNAGRNNTTGSNGTHVGRGAGQDNTEGNENTNVGAVAGFKNTTGSGNTSIGHGAGFNNIERSDNTLVGDNAGRDNTQGDRLTIVGSQSGYRNKGDDNSIFGYSAARDAVTGSDNTIIGSESMRRSAGDLTGVTLVGSNSGFYINGDHVTSVGFNTNAIFTNGDTILFDTYDESTRIGTVNAGHGLSSAGWTKVVATTYPTGLNNNTIIAYEIISSTEIRFIGNPGTGGVDLGLLLPLDISRSTAIGWEAVNTKPDQVVLGGPNVTEVVVGNDNKGVVLKNVGTAVDPNDAVNLTTMNAAIATVDNAIRTTRIAANVTATGEETITLTGLTQSLEAGKEYVGELYVTYSTSETGGLDFNLSVDTPGATSTGYLYCLNTNETKNPGTSIEQNFDIPVSADGVFSAVIKISLTVTADTDIIVKVRVPGAPTDYNWLTGGGAYLTLDEL